MVILEVTPSLLHSGCAKVQLSYPDWDIQSFQVISWEITTSKSPPPTLFFFFFLKQAQKEYLSDCYDPTSCQKSLSRPWPAGLHCRSRAVPPEVAADGCLQ